MATASVSDSGSAAGGTFTLSATARNVGGEASAATTLRFYRSTVTIIATSDTEVGTDEVGALAASGTSDESVSLTYDVTPAACSAPGRQRRNPNPATPLQLRASDI